MKTGVKVLIGVAAAAGLYFITREKKVGPWEKMAMDLLNPNSYIGKDQRRYLDSVNQPYSEQNLLSHVIWSQNNPNSPSHKAYTAKASWGINEVITY